jgi:hypothetical protein
LATGRSLSDEVKKNGPFDEQTSKQYFAQKDENRSQRLKTGKCFDLQIQRRPESH